MSLRSPIFPARIVGDAPSRCLRFLHAAMRFVLCCAIVFPSLAGAQTTNNAFVGAKVVGGNGLLTIYKGDPANRELLSYIQKSYLTVKVDGRYYSNNPIGGKLGPSGAPQPIDVVLSNGQTSKIRDTIKTLWKESGFDIVQSVYPVAFTNSGVIVLSVKIVNHLATPLDAQAQFLLDNMNSNTTGGPNSANDNPYLIHRYGYIRNWEDCPPSPIPSFYLAFEHPPTDPFLGTVGIGYVNDSFPPRPLGLLPLSFLEFGDWTTAQVYYTWGPPNAGDRNTFTDEATLMMGQPMAAYSFEKGFSDSVTEIMRTAYGTPEWCYDHGNIFGFALYPHHLYWDRISGTYSPNPFQVETFLFNVSPGATSNTTIRQTVGDPIRITSPKPSGLSKDTTQMQSVGSIMGDGFADFRWTDSVLVLPTGCASSFPVDIRFDVTAGGIPTPVFVQPWDCSITVDCANPDTLPPSFLNSFAGCDSIQYDTVTVQDNTQFDLGLDTIMYSSPDLNPAQYRVRLTPAPPYHCLSTPVRIYVQQIDTFKSGHVIFTFRDCANNLSRDTVCFTAHPPLPDLTAPMFWLDSAVADCHARCRVWGVTDTLKSARSIDRGIDSIVIVSATNMTPSGIPPGGKYPAGTLTTTFHVCVTDSMLDGTIILRANDTAHNFRFDTITYCTTRDTLAPIITAQSYNPSDSSWHIHVTETRAWDRGIDSVWLEQATNVITIPSPIPYPIGCTPTFDFRVRVLDTTQCAGAMVFARDCANPHNVSSPTPLSFPKGAIPVIVASKTILCNASDSALLDAGAGYSGYLWSNGKTTQKTTVGPGSYFVTVQEGAGCPATSKSVTLAFSPAAPQITPAGPIALCAPDSVKLDGGAGYVTYQWLKDGVDTVGATSQTILARTTAAYSVRVTNASGCAGTSPAVSVTINPIPAQPVITSVNNVMTSTLGASYQWSRNGTPIPGATNQTYTDLTGGSYTVTITDAHGCSNTSLPFSNSGSTLIGVTSMVFAQQSNQVNIALSVVKSQGGAPSGNLGFTAKIAFNKTLLVPNGSPLGGNLVSANVKGDSLIVEYTGAGSATTTGQLLSLPFTAALGDNSCTAVTIDSFAWNAPNIAVSDTNGTFCLTGLCYQGGTRLIDPTGAVTLSAPQPNPAYTSIQIDYELIEHGRTTLVITDLLGREVLHLVDADSQPGTYTVSADVSMLPAGMYVYSLRTPTIVKSNHLQIVR